MIDWTKISTVLLDMDGTLLDLHFDNYDKLISSHDYGHPKEDQSFWRALEDDIALDKAHALFIDDNIGILDSAKTYGIAELLAIRYPDSQKGPWDTGTYNAVEDFRELFISWEPVDLSVRQAPRGTE